MKTVFDGMNKSFGIETVTNERAEQQFFYGMAL